MTMGRQISYVISRLYFTLRSTKLVRIILIKSKCSQFTPMQCACPSSEPVTPLN